MSVKPGQTLGQYVVIAPLGKGGMASVFRASQPSLSREVAIKVLPEFFADDAQFHERFRQEAVSIARLRHSNILTVFDSGEADGVPYIVMELVEGGTLASRLGKPMPVEECVRLIGPIASALDYAHARGMVHRDIKPGNILLTADGTPILSDFGLAKIVTADSATVARLTTTGTSLGTPEYMAPEQMRQSDVGPAADVYALAVTLYEMLTGVVPYSGDTPINVMMARLNEPLRLPRERNPEISDAVQAVLVKGLAKDPQDRYASAGEMLRALAAAASALALPASSPVPSNPALSSSAASGVAVVDAPPARGRAIAWASAAVALVAVGVAAWLWQRQPSSTGTPAVATESAANAGINTTAAPAAPVIASPASVPASTPASSARDTSPAPAAAPSTTKPSPAAAPAAAPTAQAAAASIGTLPPHGKLLFSLPMIKANLAEALRSSAEDSVQWKDNGLELTASGDSGPMVALPVAGVGDFVAVMRYVVEQRPSITFRFHSALPSSAGHAMRLPAYLQLSPPAAGAQPDGVHPCCHLFDVFVAPQAPGKNAIYTGPQPVGIVAPSNEEQALVVAVTGPLMVVSAGGREIARMSDDQFAAGAMSFSVTRNRGEPPATLFMRAFDIYEPASPANAAAAPATSTLGKPIYSMADHLSELTRPLPQQAPGNTVTLKGTSLELSEGSDQFLMLPVQAGVLDNFVAVLRVALVNLRPFLTLHVRQVPEGIHPAVRIPIYRRIGAPAGGSRPLGLHPCCEEFDVSAAPRADSALFTGPPVRLTPALPGDEQTVIVSVKGTQIVVYADGREIARATDSSPRAGGISLQLQPGGKQLPAVVRLNALDIYPNP